MIRKVYQNKMVLLSAVLVVFIAYLLAHMKAVHGNVEGHGWLSLHHYLFVWVRISIILVFLFVWPSLVTHWARKYSWSDEYAVEVQKRRWRYAMWFIIANLVFQFT